MSYIPDYRCDENEKLLNKTDTAFVSGYRAAIEDALCFFDNLDVYDYNEESVAVVSEAREDFEDWMDMQDTEMTCSIFEGADYIPEDVELIDTNPSYK